jgi:hypothetical protein
VGTNSPPIFRPGTRVYNLFIKIFEKLLTTASFYDIIVPESKRKGDYIMGIWRYRIEYKGKEMLVFSNLWLGQFEQAHPAVTVISFVYEEVLYNDKKQGF